VLQRENLTHGNLEDKAGEELERSLSAVLLPSSHLRVCEVAEHAGALGQQAWF